MTGYPWMTGWQRLSCMIVARFSWRWSARCFKKVVFHSWHWAGSVCCAFKCISIRMEGARLWYGPLLVVGVGLLREALKALPKHSSRQRWNAPPVTVWPFALWTWRPQLVQAAALCRSSALTWNSPGCMGEVERPNDSHAIARPLHNSAYGRSQPAIMHCRHQHHAASGMEAFDMLSRTSGAKHPKSISQYLTISQESRGWGGAKQSTEGFRYPRWSSISFCKIRISLSPNPPSKTDGKKKG